jgi:serine protease Do
MSRTIVVLLSLLMLAAAPAPPARPAKAPAPGAPATPPTPRPAPRDRTIFFSSGSSWLGVSIADVTSERAKELNMKEETGAEIKAVMPGSPAEEAGLKKGDVILEYQTTRVEGAMQLTRMVRETPPGRTVSLKTLRDGETRAVRVKMTGHEGEEAERHFHRRIEIPPIDIPPVEIPDIELPEIPFLESIPSSFRLGVSVEELGDQLAEYFGVKGGEGLLVRSVKKGSPADEAGLRAGDVIVKVDGEAVADSGDLRSALRDHRGRTFALTIVRDRRQQTVNVTLPKAEEPTEENLEESRFEGFLEEGVQRRMEAAMRRLEAASAALEARHIGSASGI